MARTIVRSRKKFSAYNQTTYIGTTLKEVVGNSIIGRMRHIDIDSNHTIGWDLLQNNNLGAKNLSELLKANLGIFSPLSGDYLMAAVYSSYLKRTRGKSLSIKPVAINKKLSAIFFQDKKVFQDKDSIGIYIDTTGTGKTGFSLLNAIRKEYPEKTIYEPRKGKAEFPQSEKIRAFWEKYT